MPKLVGNDRAEWIERLPFAARRRWVGIAAAVLLSLAALTVRQLADTTLPPGYPFLTFFPAVIIAAFLFGVLSGTLTAVLCGLLAWYFFIPGGHGWQLSSGALLALGFFAFVTATDILLVAWMQRANARLRDARERNRRLAETRELLFSELQHRVSNNLQVAAGLLVLQKRGVADPAARAALDEAADRLARIGRISRQLYDAAGAARTMRSFLEPLCHDVIAASGRAGIVLSVHGDDDVVIDPDAAVPVALIVAEALANAIEHGFEGRETGRVEVVLAREPTGRIDIEIRDDGRGLPPGFDAEASASLGLRIARAMAKQLRGRFDLVAGNGVTIARLILPG